MGFRVRVRVRVRVSVSVRVGVSVRVRVRVRVRMVMAKLMSAHHALRDFSLSGWVLAIHYANQSDNINVTHN